MRYLNRKLTIVIGFPPFSPFAKVQKNGQFETSHYIHISLVRKITKTFYERSCTTDDFTNTQQIKSIKK